MKIESDSSVLYLLLPEDEDPSRLDGVPGGQVVSSTQLLPVLVGLPQAVPSGPGDADVVPPPVTHRQGQLGHLDRSEHGHKRMFSNNMITIMVIVTLEYIGRQLHRFNIVTMTE